MSEQPSVAHPAATVVLLRDAVDGLEVLLLRRNSRLAFHGGAWVFPGGRIDDEDFDGPSRGDVATAARAAAVREAREESSLEIPSRELVPVSRWVTPEIRPKRFDTWFFAARVDARGPEVEVDGGEILDHRWLAPNDAIAARARGEIELPPPTFVTLLRVSHFARAELALADLAGTEPLEFRPKVHRVEGGLCSLYAGDAGFVTSDPHAAGPRHRLWMLESGWRYERA